MPNPAASPTVSSTVGLKNMVIAELTTDTEETLTYGDLQLVAGAIEASIEPQNADPDVQFADDIEFDVLYPDPELTFKTKMADIPLTIQEKVFGNKIDDNGVLIRSASDTPPYYAVGFMSEKSNHKFRYVWLFKVRAKPVTENYSTKPQVPLCVAVQGAGQAGHRELLHQGGHQGDPADRGDRVDGHQAHPRRPVSGGCRRGRERLYG